MKKFFGIAGLILLAASCSSDESGNIVDNKSDYAPVTVAVSGFSVNQGDIVGTRAQTVSDYTKVKFLTLAFYASNGTEVYKHTQNRDDNTTFTTFGDFYTSLKYGEYTMVVLANGGNNAITLTSPTLATYGENIPRDTWAYTQAVNITSNDAMNLSATLSRICSALAVLSTDNRPAEVTHMRFTFSRGAKSFSPTTGFATVNTGFTVMFGLPDTTLGKTSYTGTYLFLSTDDEDTMDVTVETLDAADGNVLFSKTVSNVPLKRNRETTLTGAIYSGTGVTASGFLVNTDWLDSEAPIHF